MNKPVTFRELLLDRRKQTTYLAEAWLGSCILFFGATTVFGRDLVSLPYAVLSAITLLVVLLCWRVLLQSALRSEAITRLLRQRIVILGWSEGTAQLSRQTWEAFVYPCEIIGYVEIAAESDASVSAPTVPCLGTKQI